MKNGELDRAIKEFKEVAEQLSHDIRKLRLDLALRSTNAS